MSSPDSQVRYNLFYYQELAYAPKKVHIGYMKAFVKSKVERTVSGKKWKTHPYFPVFFVPFMTGSEEYIFADHFAFEAKDVTPGLINSLETWWNFHI